MCSVRGAGRKDAPATVERNIVSARAISGPLPGLLEENFNILHRLELVQVALSCQNLLHVLLAQLSYSDTISFKGTSWVPSSALDK